MGIEQTAIQTKAAAIKLAALSGDVKNRVLASIRDALKARQAEIVAANQADLERSETESVWRRLCSNACGF